MDNNDKAQALNEVIKNLERDHGKGVIMKLGDQPMTETEVISSGSLALNEALGIGGLPKGRITEIYGPESSGKTTLALHAIAEAQKKGGLAAFIDAEHALDVVYAKAIGIDIENLYISQPNNGEQALEILDDLLCSRSLDIVVVDSVAALVPKSEIEGNMGDPHMALQARLMSQALRKITASVSKSNSSVIFINQLRSKIGVMFGNPETTTGGNALKFYTSIRLDIRKIETLKRGDAMVGSKVKVKVVKNKLAPPFKLAIFDIYYGEGISKISELLDMAVSKDIVKKSGSWFSYNGERIGQGLENAKAYLKENPKTLKEIEEALKKPSSNSTTLKSSLSKAKKEEAGKKEPSKEPVPESKPNF